MISEYNDINVWIPGDLGKELKNLITMMDQEEEESEAETGKSRKTPLKNSIVSKLGLATNSNKESPVWTFYPLPLALELDLLKNQTISDPALQKWNSFTMVLNVVFENSSMWDNW